MINLSTLKSLLPSTSSSGANKAVWMSLGGILLLATGYGMGRYVQPEKVLVTEKIKEVEKLVVVEKIKTEVQIVKVYLENKNEKVHRVVTEEKKLDGTETKTTTEDIGTETVIRENTNSTEIKYVDRVVEKIVEKEVERLKLVESKKLDWRVAAGAGVAIPYFLGQGSPGVPGLGGAVINAEVDRRIVSNFWLGIHGNSQGVVGLNLSGLF